MAWDYYKEGVSLGGVKVLERLNSAYLQGETRYRVRALCCDTVLEMTHRSISQRAQRGTPQCQFCQLEKARKERGKKRRAMRDDIESGPGTRDASGYFWPMLGQLGPRFGAGGAQFHTKAAAK